MVDIKYEKKYTREKEIKEKKRRKKRGRKIKGRERKNENIREGEKKSVQDRDKNT